MSVYKPLYHVEAPLPKITDPFNLPAGMIELGKIEDTVNENWWYLIKNNEKLSILKYHLSTLPDGSELRICKHRDFPLGFLSWYPKALTDFQKPPSQGGLHAGAMSSADQNVEGEMLCIQACMATDRTGGGYAVLNRTRCEDGYDPDTEFEAQEISWSEHFLFDVGMLKLIKDLGDKYEKGLI